MTKRNSIPDQNLIFQVPFSWTSDRNLIVSCLKKWYNTGNIQNKIILEHGGFIIWKKKFIKQWDLPVPEIL